MIQRFIGGQQLIIDLAAGGALAKLIDVLIDRPAITLGQQIGQDWYAAVERRIASRLYATAYAATQQEGRSLPIGAAYGAEFKLRWDLD